MNRINIKRYILSSLFVLGIFGVIEYIGHIKILGESYANNPQLMRTGGADILLLNLIGGGIFSFVFSYVFAKGYEGKGIMEGIRFALVIGGLIWFPNMLFDYANFNFPGSWPLVWFIFGMIATFLSGIFAALIYRPIREKKESEGSGEL